MKIKLLLVLGLLLSSSPVFAALCPPGSYNSMNGEDPCTPCDVGTFQPNTGQLSCFDCEPGTFTAFTGSIACSECPAGRFNDEPAQTECFECEPGTFNDEAGATTCMECPANEYSDEQAAEECKICPEGKESKVGSTKCVDKKVEVDEVQTKEGCHSTSSSTVLLLLVSVAFLGLRRAEASKL